MAAILTTSVAMEYQPRRRQSAQVRHFQGILHQAGLHVGLDAPSYDLSTEQVEHGRQIQPTLLCRQIRDVTTPDLIWCRRIELPLYQIRGHRQRMLAVGRGNILAFDPATHAMGLHQQPHPFLAYTQPSATQLLMDSWPTIFPLDLAVDGSDVNQHPLIRQPPARRSAATALPTVVAALTDSQHPANRPDRPVALHFLNPGVLCSVSCAKYAAAFFAISRSILSCTTSARKRAISICSADTAPGAVVGVATTPSSPRCCWRTQLPKLAFGMPSELATEPTDAPASTCRTLSSLNSCVYLARLLESDIPCSFFPI